MPKPGKASRTARKRFKITGSGKVMVRRAHRAHYMTKKSKRRKRTLKVEKALSGRTAKEVKKALLLA